MDQKRLSKWMKIIVIGAALCGLVVYAFVVPGLADEERTMYPEFENRYLPWLLFLLGTGLPCFAALIPAWMIAADIRFLLTSILSSRQLKKAQNIHPVVTATGKMPKHPSCRHGSSFRQTRHPGSCVCGTQG